MPEPDNKPSEEQVQAANQAEEQRWQGDFKEEDLTVPYKHEEEKAEVATETPDKDEQEEPQEQEVYAETAPVVTVADPGEYKPADYSFEVKDKNGKSVKITSPEEADKFGEDDDNFKTAADLKNYLRQTQKMQNSLDKDHDKWEEQASLFKSQNELQEQRTQEVNAIANEMDYLISKGKLPKADDAYLNADWSKPDVAKQPGVKEQLALLNYMNKENATRKKLGIKPFGPVDALTAMQSDASEQAKVTAAKEAGEARKAAGARVAGVSSTQTSAFVPKGIAVGNPNVFKRGQSVWD